MPAQAAKARQAQLQRFAMSETLLKPSNQL
jgi:hypothetical protein